MSKPDFEQTAYDRLAGKQVVMGGLPYTRQFGEVFSATLRAAHEAGQSDGFRRGLERAAEIAETHADLIRASITHDREHRKHSRVYEAICLAKIIRAEKETK